MRSPYPEFVLTGFICIEKALKGTEIVLVLTVFVFTRFYQGCLGNGMEMGIVFILWEFPQIFPWES